MEISTPQIVEDINQFIEDINEISRTFKNLTNELNERVEFLDDIEKNITDKLFINKYTTTMKLICEKINEFKHELVDFDGNIVNICAQIESIVNK